MDTIYIPAVDININIKDAIEVLTDIALISNVRRLYPFLINAINSRDQEIHKRVVDLNTKIAELNKNPLITNVIVDLTTGELKRTNSTTRRLTKIKDADKVIIEPFLKKRLLLEKEIYDINLQNHELNNKQRNAMNKWYHVLR